MANFIIRFLFCNLFICMMIGILLTAKQLFKSKLTSRMQYNLWFLLLLLLAVPFLPVQSIELLQIFSWLALFKNTSASQTTTVMEPATALHQSDTANWMNDLSISVSQGTSSNIGMILCAIWFAGILTMIVFMVKSKIHLDTLKKSSLPLQNKAVRKLYRRCLTEMNITKNIPVYSTAFLKSPIIVGLFKPCIYLPIHLISDSNAVDIRYMLLHELKHYKHKDALANYFMNAASILYWFNPLVWYALKEMRSDREIACDTSVLKMLDEDAYQEYGSTLINFAEKISFMSSPFASGIGGNMAQMKRRILNIANYRPISFQKKLYGILAYVLIAIFLCGFIPILTTQAADQNHYYFDEKSANISYIDLSKEFSGYNGSFVLYDATADSWQIYNKDYAATRISPVSTYKIYIALAGLQAGIITPEHTQIPWDGQENIYDVWNADQTLESAMHNSVNWYFQSIDQEVGLSSIKNYVKEIGYGSQTISGDASSYWLNSSLKISPIEQVEMLKKLYYNEFQFSPENIETVKNSIHLFTTADGSVYGKTGTEKIADHDASGWFIGYLENKDHVYFFAANIQNNKDAAGSAAAALTFSILSDWNLFHQELQKEG